MALQHSGAIEIRNGIIYTGLSHVLAPHEETSRTGFCAEFTAHAFTTLQACSLSLSSLSQHAMRPSRDYGGCSVLRRYFAQLHLLRARFPPDTGQLPIDFVWWVGM